MNDLFPKPPSGTLETLAALTDGQLFAGIVLEAPFYAFIYPPSPWDFARGAVIGSLGSFPAIKFDESRLRWSTEPEVMSIIDLRTCCLWVDQDITKLPGWQSAPEAGIQRGVSTGWHNNWTLDDRGQLAHVSGIKMNAQNTYHGCANLIGHLDPAALAIYRVKEGSRGVNELMLAVNIANMIKEGRLWLEFCREIQPKRRR
jgi:hypothetical protein